MVGNETSRFGITLSASTARNILALNALHERETSVLGRCDLDKLIREAFHLGLAGDDGQEGFLIALDDMSSYGSQNYLWFKQRYAHFVYIDRVIVAPTARGRGVGRKLYQRLLERCVEAGTGMVCCEVNIEPPNEASDAFHAALGFQEIGRSTLAPSGKIVRYLSLDLRRSLPPA